MKSAALALLILAAAGAAQAMAAPPLVVALPTEVQRKLGVATEAAPAARHSGATTAFARVLDPVPLATLDADLVAAAGAAQASQAEAARTRSLAAADATVSAKTAEAAAAQARADAAKVALLRRRLGLEWGPAFMTMSDVRRADLIARLAGGRAALVRVDAASGTAGVDGVTLDLGPDGKAFVQMLGPARTGDARLMSVGLLGVVSGPPAARLGAGMTVPATLAAGGGQPGVLVPRGAVIRAGGETYAYVRKDAGRFERRTLGGVAAEPGGLFVASGLRPGEPVVVSGAAALHAAEAAPKAAPTADVD